MQKQRETITLTIDYDNHDALTDTKRDMQRIARGKKRITFDDVLRYYRTLPKEEKALKQFVLDLIGKKE